MLSPAILLSSVMLLAQARYDRTAWLDWSWVTDRWSDTIYPALREHVILTVLTMVIGLALSLPLAVLASRRRWLYAPMLSTTGVLYTIPSLALLALLVPYTGLSRTTALIPLVSYTLLILIRNTVSGLDAVPADVIEAADGMGYQGRQRLLRVELPLAVPSILAGVRIATVTTIGLVTVTSLIGQENLGQLILDGFGLRFRTPMVVGTVLAVALAVVADVSLGLLQRLSAPWARPVRPVIRTAEATEAVTGSSP
jgi:osmoprotectant transport system permease protein